ncbi:MAG: phosphoribosyltransferase [Gammaproteobacteria bacterium]|nr:phosphoribosyltransferase [Gammaproteobacteria bacterium]
MMPDAITPFVGLRGSPEEMISVGDGEQLRVYYLDVYFPGRFAESKTHQSTSLTIDFKHGVPMAVRHFSALVLPRFENNRIAPAFVAVPGHRKGPATPTGGLRQIIAKVAGAIDLSDCLRRTVEIRKSAGAARGTRPDVKKHIDTMEIVSAERLHGKNVVVFDDVLTRGDTMRAARYIVAKFGKPASLTCLCLMRTRLGTQSAANSWPPRAEDIEF